VRRRNFIIGAAAATLPTAGTAHPASGATVPSWDVVHDETRYRVMLNGTELTCDCLPREGAGEASTNDVSTRRPSDVRASLVSVGWARQEVFWRIGESRQPDPLTLQLSLEATNFPLMAEVTFAIDPPTGILVRRTTIRHDGNGAEVPIRTTLSGCFGLHEPIDHAIYLSGSWSAETETQRDRRFRDALVLQSRDGKTGFGSQPHVLLRAGGSTYLCQLLWSGNWSMRIVPTADGAAITGGLNNWRFHHRLRPGTSLDLPAMLFCRVKGNANMATQRLHDYRRSLRPDPDRSIPVQFNSWYPYFGDPTAVTMLALIPAARKLGCEAFVIDAGWYRTDDGESDADWQQGTGDWRTSRRRFPNGLSEISAACHDQGMKFGLWFEPEVIGQLSGIRHTHPEWLHHIDGTPPSPHERAVLNLGVPQAWRHACDRVSRIIDIVGVAWMKWDFNADIGAGGWAPGLPDALTAQDPLIAHYEGLYSLQDEIRRRFPDLILEMCASGGGRLDGEILSHAHVNWISDQPSALRKLAIHFGSQLAHPAVDCNDWLVEWPPGNIDGYDDDPPAVAMLGDLPFRLRVAMLGSFGISARIDRWPEADLAVAAAHVADYAGWVRPIVHHGDQYLLTSGPAPGPSDAWAAIWYAAKDGLSGALFVFRLGSREHGRQFGLPGLAPQRRFRVTGAGSDFGVMSGTELGSGLLVRVAEKYRSQLIRIEAA
jgi:alpha-galactosidase